VINMVSCDARIFPQAADRLGMILTRTQSAKQCRHPAYAGQADPISTRDAVVTFRGESWTGRLAVGSPLTMI